MALTAKGPGGEIRVGGRIAATLSKWELETIGGAWICSAEMADISEALLEHPSPKELRLSFGPDLTWRFKGVTDVVPSGAAVTITGAMRPETF
jgi:hypothetical protein